MNNSEVWVIHDMDYLDRNDLITLFTTKDLASRFFNEITDAYTKESTIPVVKQDNLFISDIATVHMFSERLWSEYPEN